ncbi:MAG: polyprenyl synthetase family protein [Gemmatimonadota bacterium]|nr:polyprenyl synthetase family protein [Gemmatimonadota bacterium]MDH5759786.1 polyprenyl synthetase family protein [Gemmatimonadota bacterium]
MDSSLSQMVRGAPPRLSSIQGPVQEQLDRVGDELRRIVLSDFDMIGDVNDHLLFVQGKLFRPTLLLLASQVGGRAKDDALTLAAVVELVHLATLVHDDAVDHSVLRRGMPTVNALWTHQVAIIMGDYLYSRSVSELARLGHLDALAVLAKAANEMSVGEMRQLTSYDALDFTEADYYRLIAAKTASLMAAACEMGALAGVPAYREPLRRFGHNLGMAFQIADDLLDYTGTEEVTGKPTGHDLRERKVTLPLVGAMENTSDVEHEEIRKFFTRVDPSDDEIQRIVDIVAERGGLEYARGRARHYADLAEESLATLSGSVELDALRDSVSYAVDRSR